jgi:DMSO/TMAO reductase YedYZ heme-binding membrane subunit
MTSALVGTVGHGTTALWFLTRATGLVTLILLSATVMLGTVASVGWTTERWPRFLSQAVHRNLSLFCLALLGVHVLSTVVDGYVPISLLDAVIPFRSQYRPVWVGFGALALDMLIAVAVTSGLRRRIGTAAWRGVHWLAYACWPVAVLHGLGSGTDAKLPGTLLVMVGCIGGVTVAVVWRLLAGRARSLGRRLGGAVAVVVVLLSIAVFAAVGPLRPGWSHRSGTSAALLSQLANATTSTNPSSPHGTRSSPAASHSTAIPAVPFSSAVTGHFTTSAPNADGDSVVTLSMSLADTTAPLQIRIIGPAENGGVAMRRSSVTFGGSNGQVTALEGANIGAVVNGPNGPVELAMRLSLDPSTGTLTGQISGSATQ